MQNNIKRKKLKKVKALTLVEGQILIDTYILEIKMLFGLTIFMGIISKPNILKQWSTLYYTPTFLKVMICDRFRLLQEFLHFKFNTNFTLQIPAIVPMMGEEAVVTKFVL